ncbi:MAG: translation initiation factor IF-3 [Verrucomicrobiota bacterium]|nr:translation initiation factor IF-3 [Verrucomicrobiota bacterium]MDE3065970.1 translation initiation factor IF-3 [Verrucomicrobiota bacterium]
MSRPFPPRHSFSGSFVRVNGKIRAREVRVIDGHDKNLGVLSLNDALGLARQQGVDLVEISPNATPPVCRLVDYGKFRYEQAKKEKESKKRQHASTVKEIQLSPRIDPHDLSVKVAHAVDFLCQDMKVKVALRFRGREMAHQEIGFEVVRKFLGEIAAYGHPDFEPKLLGRGIHVMVSPLPRNKRAKNSRQPEDASVPAPANASAPPDVPSPQTVAVRAAGAPPPGGFANNPFANLEVARDK